MKITLHADRTLPREASGRITLGRLEWLQTNQRITSEVTMNKSTNDIVLLDGGMGQELQKRSVQVASL